MKFKEPIVLFKTIVGSKMWGQHRSDSDTDLFECYVFDSRSFLLGNTHDGGHSSKKGNEDKDSFEIGHVVRQLIKGNVNFLWGVMSPKVIMYRHMDQNIFDLRKIVKDNLSKATTYSIRGFVIHNLKHWFGLKIKSIDSIEQYNRSYIIVEKKLPRLIPKDKKYWKILNTCARTLDFGIKLLRDGKLDFDHPRGAVSPRDVLLMLGELEQAYKESRLPEKSNPAPFEEFLLKIRKVNFIGL